ncbi:MAG: L,D-transpeptidase [Clostridia bacterium]|nr:L,D-transpeptidase [Clostridia bacterium]
MKTRFVLLITLAFLLLLFTGQAFALQITNGRINPFAENELTVTSDQPGLLTIHVAGYMDAVTDLPIKAGKTTITWHALSWGGEPITAGLVQLYGELTLADGTVVNAHKQIRVRTPRSAVLLCLPEQSTYVIGGDPLRVELGVSAEGNVQMSLVPAGGGDAVWLWGGQVKPGKDSTKVTWDWGRPRAPLEPGEYILRAWTRVSPDWVVETPLTLVAEDPVSRELFLTGSVLPDDPEDDEAVWAAITAPAIVGTGYEQHKLHLLAEKNVRAEVVGDVYRATVALTVLELCDDGWARVGAWNHGGGEFVEGWVQQENLMVVTPNIHYGVLVDKRTQELRVYQDGHCIGKVTVSTGLQVTGEHLLHSETRAGAYLTGTRWNSFATDGVTYQYPIRIDGPNLIHQVGWRTRSGIPNGLEIQEPLLGTKASHGCIRVARTSGEGGINAFWLWTHLGKNTKVLVIDDPETRHARMDELGIPY